MREIIFRGVCTETGEWVYGGFAGFRRLRAARDMRDTGAWIVGATLLCKPVFPETVGQFTGHTDRFGERIFEGDILKAQLRADGKGDETWTSGVILWDDARGGWGMLEKGRDPADGLDEFDGWGEWELAGNAWQDRAWYTGVLRPLLVSEVSGA